MTAITPANITLSDVYPPIIKAAQVPDGEYLIDTRPDRRDGSRPVEVVPGPVEPVPSVGELFRENFDSQPDWTSTMHSIDSAQTADAGYTVPEGWYGIYQGTKWSPENGQPTKHASAEILASNADKARGGTGKSMVNWRESRTNESQSYWASDSHMVRLLGGEYPEVYTEFWIRFSENWWPRAQIPSEMSGPSFVSKMFRVGYWAGDEVGNIWSGFEKAVGPRFFWDYRMDQYGVRNVMELLSGPPDISSGLPIGGSRNYTSHTAGKEVGGANPQHKDQIGGGDLVNFSGSTRHENVFGASEHWTKMGFQVKLNSSPGTQDGLARVWINDNRIVNYENVEWIKAGSQMAVNGFNYIAIGGNDYFYPIAEEEQFEDWYSIDDVIVRDSLPEGLA